ncbi:hypothetical protein, partial [Roseovarius sp.]|uniref:hypothetical protein n=1 Tax=Roseovarius sp. TaxID=1486281 RepID=UPI0035619A75
PKRPNPLSPTPETRPHSQTRAGEGWPKATSATLRTKHGLDARPARPQRQRPPPPSPDELAVARRVREAIVRIAAIPAPT